MEGATLAPLAAWGSFYVIVGSSAAALTGLQFVVIALVADRRGQSNTGTIDTFGTPTIVHFCATLLVSAVVSAPWQRLSNAALVLGLCGAAGVVYGAIVVRRARRQTGYKPVMEDRIWHFVLPITAYGALVVGAAALGRDTRSALFTIGATTLLLLFVGIHNAWDSVTYVAVEVPLDDKKAAR
jgi:F0F1-type ATP synthase assembly protein I